MKLISMLQRHRRTLSPAMCARSGRDASAQPRDRGGRTLLHCSNVNASRLTRQDIAMTPIAIAAWTILLHTLLRSGDVPGALLLDRLHCGAHLLGAGARPPAFQHGHDRLCRARHVPHASSSCPETVDHLAGRGARGRALRSSQHGSALRSTLYHSWSALGFTIGLNNTVVSLETTEAPRARP